MCSMATLILCFVSYLANFLSMPLKSVSDACEFAFKNRSIFPTVYKAAKLLYTASVSVTKHERAVSKIKVIKNCL